MFRKLFLHKGIFCVYIAPSWTLFRNPAFLFLKCNSISDVEEEDEAMLSTDPSRFVTDPEFGYQEFARREEDHFQVFRVQVGDWDFALGVTYQK